MRDFYDMCVHVTTNALLHEEHCNQQAKEFAGESRKDVNVFARVDGGQNDYHQRRPVQGGGCELTQY